MGETAEEARAWLAAEQAERDAEFDRRMASTSEHPSWCKCQRVCGGDQ